MNKVRRKKLGEAVRLLDTASDIVYDVYDEESDSLSNIPESLEGSDRYSKMEECIDYLEDAKSMIEEATAQIREAMV